MPKTSQKNDIVITDKVQSLRFRRFLKYQALETLPLLPNQLKRLIYRGLMAYWSRKIDIYIVSYPKVGSLWYFTMLNSLFGTHYGLSETEFMKIATRSMRNLSRQGQLEGFPLIHVTHHMPLFNSETSDEMNMDWFPFQGKKVILLAREPKDTLVSLYFHLIYHQFMFGDLQLFQGSLNDMVHNKVYGIEKYLRFYKEWYYHKHVPDDLLLIRYEDHRSNPGDIVRKTAKFIGIEQLADSTVEEVVSFSSFKNMQKRRNVSRNSQKSPSEDAHRIRKGKVGNYRDHLDNDTIHYIDELVAKELPAFYNYSTSE